MAFTTNHTRRVLNAQKRPNVRHRALRTNFMIMIFPVNTLIEHRKNGRVAPLTVWKMATCGISSGCQNREQSSSRIKTNKKKKNRKSKEKPTDVVIILSLLPCFTSFATNFKRFEWNQAPKRENGNGRAERTFMPVLYVWWHSPCVCWWLGGSYCCEEKSVESVPQNHQPRWILWKTMTLPENGLRAL